MSDDKNMKLNDEQMEQATGGDSNTPDFTGWSGAAIAGWIKAHGNDIVTCEQCKKKMKRKEYSDHYNLHLAQTGIVNGAPILGPVRPQ